MPHRVYLAIDLGAESGRVMAGLWNGKTIRLEEIHRFPNGPVYLGDSLRWDVVRLWAEIQNGLALAAKKYGKAIVSVGADTWGVDYVLLTGSDEMLGQPYAYRDARTNGMMEKAFKKVPRAEIFAQTGLQFMQFNTLFQLLAHKQAQPGPARSGGLPAVHARLHPLGAVRLARRRVHHRLHLAVPEPAHAQLGDRPAEEVRPADAHVPEGRAARHQAGRAAARRGRADRPAQGQRGRPADA